MDWHPVDASSGYQGEGCLDDGRKAGSVKVQPCDKTLQAMVQWGYLKQRKAQRSCHLDSCSPRRTL